MTKAQLEAFVDDIMAASASKPELEDMTPSRTDLGAGLTAFKAAVTTEDNAKVALSSARVARRNKTKALRKLVNEFAGAAEGVYAGDAASLTAIGLPLRASAQPVGILPAPANLRTYHGPLDDSIKARWNTVKGRTHFEMECATSPNGPFTRAYMGGETSCICPGLTPGTEYWFRVRAWGAAGPSPWSDLARRRAA